MVAETTRHRIHELLKGRVKNSTYVLPFDNVNTFLGYWRRETVAAGEAF